MNKNSALSVLCLASFLVPFMGSAINLSLPQIGEEFAMKTVSLSWIATAYLITTAVFQIPFARLADLIGRKKVFISGIIIFGFATLSCTLAPSGIILIILRAISGLGCAMMFGTNMAILTAIFPAKERGKAIGINTFTVYAALASGPFLGGLLTHYWGWQSLFYSIGTLGLLVAAGAYLFLKGEWIESKGESFDYLGSIIYAFGLFGLIFGFSELPKIQAFFWIAAGLISFSIFIVYELKDKHPVLNVRIFSGNKIFSLSCISALINYACTSATAFLLSLYLQYIREFNSLHAGRILIIQAFIQCIISIFAGKLSDKMNPSILATSGMSITAAGLIGFIFLTQNTPIIYIILLISLLGLGFGMFASPNSNIIMSSVDKKYYGQASATIGTMRLTGQAFSMGIAMMALSLHVGNRVITPELHPMFMQSLRVSFIICAALCLIGAFASSFRVNNNQIK